MKNPANLEALQDHPAVRYWEQLGISSQFASLEVLQNENTRSVFRLENSASLCYKTENSQHVAAEAGTLTAVIAKRAPRPDIDKEFNFYQTLLPGLSISALQTFGIVEDENPEFAWLFMSDAGNRHYDPDNREHRKLAACWLARLHRKSVGNPRPGGLDDRGPGYFFPYLTKSLNTLESHRQQRKVDDADQLVLDDIAGFCHTLESGWGEIERFCETMPRTLVHGDIKEDNLLIGGTAQKPSLTVIDWHEGGWGVPALDLAKFLGYRVAPDFDAYLQQWFDFWPQSNIGDVRRLGYVGEVFRWIASVRWHLDDLQYGCIERAISRMAVYRDWMGDIGRAAPWRSNPELASPDWQPMSKFWH